jgi:CTP:molybdopterin cytidylyltransferase MocA
LVAAVVLAAGSATRFGSPKQLLLLPLVLDRLRESAVAGIVVVEGAHPLATLGLEDVQMVTCRDWALGPGASLRCGLAALDAAVDTAVVVLADGPNLDPRAVDRVLTRRNDAEVVAASYDGDRSHPVCLRRSAWSKIPDEGARGLPALLVSCDDLTPPGDVDFSFEL